MELTIALVVVAAEVVASLCLIWLFCSTRRLVRDLEVIRKYRTCRTDGKYVVPAMGRYLLNSVTLGQYFWGLLIALLTLDLILVLSSLFFDVASGILANDLLADLVLVVGSVMAIHGIFLGGSYMAESGLASADPSVQNAFRNIRDALWKHTMALALVIVFLAVLALVSQRVADVAELAGTLCRSMSDGTSVSGFKQAAGPPVCGESPR